MIKLLKMFFPLWFVAHWYVGQRLITTTTLPRAAKIVAWSALVLHACLNPVMLALKKRPFLEDDLHSLLMWLSFTSLSLVILLLLGTLLRDLGLMAARLWAHHKRRAQAVPGRASDPSPRVSRRQLLLNGTSAATALGAAGVLGRGHYNASRIPDVRRVPIRVPNLHPDLEGFQIVQISDVHLGNAGNTIHKPFLDEVIRRVNALKPDLVAITGDLADGYPAKLGPSIASIATLDPPSGAFYVTGNHEYHWDGPGWQATVEGLGVTSLGNAHRVVRRGGATLVVAGVNDFKGARVIPGHASSVARALEGAPEGDFRLLLAHQPGSVEEAAALGVDLQLSGHTHGGQFFPFNFIVGRVHKYVRGLAQVGPRTQLYVSCGTGYWGPPLRLMVPSEITLLTLTRA